MAVPASDGKGAGGHGLKLYCFPIVVLGEWLAIQAASLQAAEVNSPANDSKLQIVAIPTQQQTINY